MDGYNQYYPKQRTGKECKQKSCARHLDYWTWDLGSENLKFCMNCRHAHVSQYKRKDTQHGVEDLRK